MKNKDFGDCGKLTNDRVAAEAGRLLRGRDAGCGGRREVATKKGADGEAVAVNVRETSVSHMHSRGRIDEAQKAAADRFRALYEAAEIGGLRAIDPSRVQVDHCGAGDPLTDRTMSAAHELRRVALSPLVGIKGYKILVQLCCTHEGVENLARQVVAARASVGLEERRAAGYVVERLREALDGLVTLWRISATGRRKIGAEPVKIAEGREAGRAGGDDAMPAARDLSVTGPGAEWIIEDGVLMPVWRE